MFKLLSGVGMERISVVVMIIKIKHASSHLALWATLLVSGGDASEAKINAYLLETLWLWLQRYRERN